MQEKEPTRKEIATFEKLAAAPQTAVVMTKLATGMATNFECPAKVHLEIAANKLGLDYRQMDKFHEWWSFDRIMTAA